MTAPGAEMQSLFRSARRDAPSQATKQRDLAARRGGTGDEMPPLREEEIGVLGIEVPDAHGGAAKLEERILQLARGSRGRVSVGPGTSARLSSGQAGQAQLVGHDQNRLGQVQRGLAFVGGNVDREVARGQLFATEPARFRPEDDARSPRAAAAAALLGQSAGREDLPLEDATGGSRHQHAGANSVGQAREVRGAIEHVPGAVGEGTHLGSAEIGPCSYETESSKAHRLDRSTGQGNVGRSGGSDEHDVDRRRIEGRHSRT